MFACCAAIVIGGFVIHKMVEYWIQPSIDNVAWHTTNMWSALGQANLHTPIYILLLTIGLFCFASADAYASLSCCGLA